MFEMCPHWIMSNILHHLDQFKCVYSIGYSIQSDLYKPEWLNLNEVQMSVCVYCALSAIWNSKLTRSWAGWQFSTCELLQDFDFDLVQCG